MTRMKKNCSTIDVRVAARNKVLEGAVLRETYLHTSEDEVDRSGNHVGGVFVEIRAAAMYAMSMELKELLVGSFGLSWTRYLVSWGGIVT